MDRTEEEVQALNDSLVARKSAYHLLHDQNCDEAELMVNAVRALAHAQLSTTYALIATHAILDRAVNVLGEVADHIDGGRRQ